MKKITLKAACCCLLVLLTSGVIYGCGDSSKKQSTNTKSQSAEVKTETKTEVTKTVKSKDNLCEITVPESWSTADLQNKEANIQLADKSKQKCVLTASNSKKDFASSVSLDKFYALISDSMKKNLGNAVVSNVKDVTINGKKAKQFEILGEFNGLKLKYNIALIESNKAFHQVTAWTLASKFDESKKDFDKIINSFKEL